MTKANECTCPSGDGSLRHPCPAHPASVELAGVAANLTFINGRPAMCGCQVEYSSGGGEYSDVIYVTLCAKHSGSAILDLVATNRIALTPEYEGQWHADLYLDREIPLAKADGATPAEAVLALMSAERIDPEQESVEQAGGDERVIGWRERILAAHPNSDPDFWPDALLVEHMAAEIADLRAALAQPSPKCATCNDRGHVCLDWEAGAWEECPDCAQAEAERPEVASLTADLYEIAERILEIAEGRPKAISTTLMAPVRDYRLKDAKAVARVMGERLVALADRYAHHDRVVGALRFERQQMDRAFTACINERDAALANVDALVVQVLKLGGTISFDYHPVAQAGQVPQAWLDVQAERRRQVEVEGWTPEHDDAHSHGEMARAAACYALAGSSAPNDGTAALLVSLAWPWDEQWWKPSTARRDMVKACALALAEIERLDRAGISQNPQPGATTASS
ncbi:hypothetical protein MXF36_10095 [Pseudomonas aeruginosa]|uniref:hypothetical protein n=1 Tax=Pseudomonas aeruginosa TaxID=287 RepID=UPI002DB72A07|nr:hypothetical protein [Pseudomonas aeruginosa]MEB6160130.1 hypothetical protein [Pseudomonas aeruginosa]